MGKLKIAGAPISWGVCEAPGWGHQMGAERVLREMSELGLGATEFGPAGFLPGEAKARSEVLNKLAMEAIGGFFPIVIHRADHDPLPEVLEELKSYKATGAYELVIAANTGVDGYDEKRPKLDEDGWNTLFKNLNRIREACEAQGVDAVLHPHFGTMIETRDDVMQVIQGSNIKFCLDTGHMFLGGTDPVFFSQNYSDRVGHVHMKDVDGALAEKVRSGQISYFTGVSNNLYVPLGQGDIDMQQVVKNLVEGAGYSGWFVLEQDLTLSAEPLSGVGPIESVRKSVEFLRALE
ncbi:IolE Sugar phosphate isomerases/epimerases [Candidatus Nanopelagicaceae bacterium]